MIGTSDYRNKPSLVIVVVGALSCYLLVSQALAEVDNERPDLSIFKLKRVDNKNNARQRADQAISDLATGAIAMRESLFVSDNYIKCSAYAHLFKLIKNQQSTGESSGGEVDAMNENKTIRRDLVNSIAIMSASEKEFYHNLMAKSVSSGDGKMVQNFLEASELLEKQRTQKAKDTWLDLIDCMSEYMSQSKGKMSMASQVVEFLSEEQRAQAVADLKKFKSVVPVEGGSQSGMVAYLAKRITGNNLNGRSVCGRFISNDAYEQARALVQSFDDQQTANARNTFDVDDIQEEPVETMPAQPDAKLNLVTNNDDNNNELLKQVKQPNNELELVVPDARANDDDDSNSTPGAQFKQEQLAILEFIKMRLNKSKTTTVDGVNSGPSLPIQWALDFSAHWDDLQAANLDPTTAFGKRSVAFLQDERNALLAKRINEAVANYVDLVSVLAEMKMQGEIPTSPKKLEDFNKQLDRLDQLLAKMDPSFDVDDIRRLDKIWKAKYTEYNVMNRFINSNFF